MKQRQRSKRLLTLSLLLGLTALLVGHPAMVGAQSTECLDSQNIVCVNAEGHVGIGTTEPSESLHLNIPNDNTTTKAHFGNGTEGFTFYNSTIGGFVPTIWSLADNPRTSLYILGGTTPENDTGDSPLVRIEGRRPDASPVTNRPILSVGNRGANTFVVHANRNIGIGTLNPQVPLDVGGTKYPASWKRIVVTHPDQAGISVENGGKSIYLFNNGTELKLDAYDYAGESPIPLDIQISSQGNVGIQTARPEAPLHLNTRANEQGLKITKDGKNAAVFLHIAEADYGYLDLGGGTSLRGNGEKSQFSGRIEAPQVIVDGTTTTSVLQITGGADLAEPFAMTDADAIEPGMVVAIDPDNPGQLRLADGAYDRGVAGIVSGAGGISPGITLQQEGTLAVGDHPVSLSGRVYVWADASYGPIQPTDLLTSSNMPGHAMKVTEYENAHGAIIGKAMTSLEEGKGLVLVLVTLQ